MHALGQPRPLVVAFDTCAVAKLCQSDAAARSALHQLRRAVKRGDIRVLIGYPVVAEIAGLAGPHPALYRHQMRQLEELVEGRLLRSWRDRVAGEIRGKGRLRPGDAFLSRTSTAAFFREAFEEVEEAARQSTVVGAAKQRFASELRAAKTKFHAEMASTEGLKELSSYRREFRAAPAHFIEINFQQILHEYGHRFSANGVAVTGLLPDDLPTLHADVAFHCAYHFAASFDGLGPGRFEGSDLYDNQVFNDAAYAHILVTEDKRFRHIAELARMSKPRITSFSAWTACLSGMRCRSRP